MAKNGFLATLWDGARGQGRGYCSDPSHVHGYDTSGQSLGNMSSRAGCGAAWGCEKQPGATGTMGLSPGHVGGRCFLNVVLFSTFGPCTACVSNPSLVAPHFLVESAQRTPCMETAVTLALLLL